MKICLFFSILGLLFFSRNLLAQDTENQQLWLITARITYQSSYHSDTVSSFTAGSKKWEKESHDSGQESASGTISVVVENQAENPATDFLYHSDAGDPVSLTVTGSGSHSESANSRETIDGVLIESRIRNDNVSGSARQGASLYFTFSAESKSMEAILNIKAVGSYTGHMYSGGIGYGEWKDYGGDYDDYNINCGGGGDDPTDRNCKIIKTGKGYKGSLRESQNKTRHTPNGPVYSSSETTVEITVEPYKESDKPEVTLLGCSELEVGGQSMLAAMGKPVGGTFRFWAEPSSMMTVETDGSSANLTGAAAAKGTLFVEYTTPDGKTAQSSQTASCVKVESYNSGQAIPQIALYDIDGKKLSGIKTVPVDAQPANAAELVKFVPADPGVLTAVGVGSEVTLQAVRVGTTTLQAKTNCGEDTGPAVTVEVVNCDDETIATLERMMKAAQDGQKGAYQAIERIVGTKEFEELDSKIAESTGNLAIKTTGLIIGTLAGGTTAGAGVETAAGIYGKASNVMDILKGGAALSQVSNLSQLIVELGGSAMQQAIAGSIETLQAAKEFGETLGKMIGANRELQSAIKEADHWNKVIQDIVSRQKLCRGNQSAQPGAQKPANTEPAGTSPEPATNPEPATEPTAQTQNPPAQKPVEPAGNQVDEPTNPDNPSEDGTENPPTPPTGEPRQIVLPYSPAECGCSQAQNLEANEAGFTSLQTGMENLGDCVETFSKGPLISYIQTLQDWQTVLNTLQEATKAKPEEFTEVSGQSIPKMEELMKQTKTFDTVGKSFINGFNKCPDSMKSGFGLMQSAVEITVDSIKTDY